MRYIGVWMDCPTRDQAVETQLFHRDPEDIKLIKTFLYLNDVVEKTGPFCFVEKSHSNPWHSFSKILHSDEDVKKLYPKSEIKRCVGPRATFIMADTTGFHKGIKPVDGYRSLITVYYSSETPRFGNRESVFDVDFSAVAKNGPKVVDYSYS